MTKTSIDCKELMVNEISARLNNAGVLIVTNYRGLTAQDFNELRKELRNISGEYVVVKESMAKRALSKGPNNRIAEFIEGGVGIAVDNKLDPTYISKVLIKFSKGREVLKIRGGIVKGEVISKEDIISLAALPSREVMLGKLANVLEAPIQELAGALHAIIAKLVYALDAVKEKKEGEGQKVEEKILAKENIEDKKEVAHTDTKEQSKAEAIEKTEEKQDKNHERQITDDEQKEV